MGSVAVPASSVAVLLMLATLAGCSSLGRYTRPEGDGGWSAERRQEELNARAAAAGVAFDAAAAAPPAPARTAVVPGAVLDLPTALSLADRANFRIAEARNRVEGAEARFLDARGRLLPSTVGSGRYTWYTDPQLANLDFAQAMLPFEGTPRFFIRPAELGTASGTSTLPLDFSGEIRHALAAAQAGYRGERARLWATTLEEQALVVRAYFQVLETQRLREVTEQTIALERQQLADAQSRFDSGRLTKNELLVVQVALRNSDQALLRRQQAIDYARWQLNQVIGADINAPTEVAEVAERPELPPVDEVLHLAYAENPALHALVEEQQRLEETVTSLTRSRLPRFSAGGGIEYSSSEFQTPQTFGLGFVGMSVDFGTDTRREAQITEARVAAERNQVVLEQQLRELEAALRTTYQAVEERVAALATAAAAVDQADENLRIRRQQFDAGRAQSEDVLDAEALLAAQRADLATARYQAHTRRAELQQLMGLPLAALWTRESPAPASGVGITQREANGPALVE